MANVTSQDGPPAVKWSRGTDRVMHWKVLSFGHGFATTNLGGVSMAAGPVDGLADGDAPGAVVAEAPGEEEAPAEGEAPDDPAGDADAAPESPADVPADVPADCWHGGTVGQRAGAAFLSEAQRAAQVDAGRGVRRHVDAEFQSPERRDQDQTGEERGKADRPVSPWDGRAGTHARDGSNPREAEQAGDRSVPK